MGRWPAILVSAFALGGVGGYYASYRFYQDTPKTTDRIVSSYPGLTGQDRKLKDEFVRAYKSRGFERDHYLGVRKTIIARVRELQREVKNTEMDKNRQLAALAKLVEFNVVMKEANVAPASFADQSCQSANLTANIPEGVKKALEVEFQEGTFLDNVMRNVRRAHFVDDLQEYARNYGSIYEPMAGVAEETTCSAIIDWQEEGKRRDDWQLAAYLAHEAAHIEWFYRYPRDPLMQKTDRAERYAYIVVKIYLEKIFVQFVKDEKNALAIQAAIKKVSGRIRRHNQNLGLEENDFSFHFYKNGLP